MAYHPQKCLASSLCSIPFWKVHFGAKCVSAVNVQCWIQGTLTLRAPKYSIILELDCKV
ncbi:hypothetical protein BT96DRAFT_830750 [Gymnopus androsaceus JB14]|uniref:Uncharacterized protein n=1 Tax=Gymnopus androsaceus JB14 TaxID=1447944 RepID=A0A6A4H285_9AGAR|nr:hypothetical protein BT96DRAFT_830750 [Gymnopus androsaceus JB14]